MFDWIKMSANKGDFGINLLDNPLLDFTTPVNEKTGELKDRIYKANYDSFEITVYPSGRVEIQGSIHKQFAGGTNHSDFTVNNIKDAIKVIERNLAISANKLLIHNLEIGVNINIPFLPEILLDNLIVYQNTPFNNMRVKGRGHGKDVYKTHHGVKVYSKSLQYNLPVNKVRFEKKVFKMQALNAGEITLNDLTSKRIVGHCLNQLITCFDNIIIAEPVDVKTMTPKHRQIYEACTNPLNWGKFDTQQRHNKRLQFSQIISKYGTMKLKPTVRELLLKKLDLLKGQQENYKDITDYRHKKYKDFTGIVDNKSIRLLPFSK